MTVITLAQALSAHYRRNPDRVVVRLLYADRPEEVLTYRRLVEGAAGYARALVNAGVRPGEVVILILDHGPSLLWGFWGAVLCGAVPSIMPFLSEKLSPDRYRRSLAALLEVTRPAGLVTTRDFYRQAALALDRSSLVRAVLLDADIPAGEESEPTRLPHQARNAGDIVLLQHSSGTTGLQKGVALTHRAVFNQLDSYAQAIQLRPEDVVVSWLPLYHDMGLVAGFLLPTLCRVPLVLLSPFDWVRAPARLLRAVSEYGGTLTWLPNFAYNFCAQKIQEKDLDGVNLATWRAVINCSEPMDPRSHEVFLERFRPYGLRPEALATCYAMAENVFAVTQGGIESPVVLDRIDREDFQARHLARPAGAKDPGLAMLSAGRPIEGAQVQIWGEDRQPLGERQVGEVVLCSDSLLTGYYNRQDLTEVAFHEGWYLTGDLGYLAGGELYITGRKKDLIIVGGKNIYPQDLEALANQVPGVHPGRVAAFGVYNEASGTEDVVLVAEVDTGDPQARQEIGDRIRARVNTGSDVALRYVHLVDRGWLVKTSSGKVSRKAVREKYLMEGGG